MKTEHKRSMLDSSKDKDIARDRSPPVLDILPKPPMPEPGSYLREAPPLYFVAFESPERSTAVFVSENRVGCFEIENEALRSSRLFSLDFECKGVSKFKNKIAVYNDYCCFTRKDL